MGEEKAKATWKEGGLGWSVGQQEIILDHLFAKRAVEGVVRTQKGEADGSKGLFQECLERGMSAVNYALH